MRWNQRPSSTPYIPYTISSYVSPDKPEAPSVSDNRDAPGTVDNVAKSMPPHDAVAPVVAPSRLWNQRPSAAPFIWYDFSKSGEASSAQAEGGLRESMASALLQTTPDKIVEVAISGLRTRVAATLLE